MTSLEIINEIIQDYEESYKNYCNRLEFEEDKTVSEKESQEFAIQLSYFEKIKQDLEEKQKLEIKLNGLIQLIKDLFNEIEINCEPEYYTNNYGEEACEDVCTIKHNYNYFHITDELFDILYSLKKGYIKDKAGDSNE